MVQIYNNVARKDEEGVRTSWSLINLWMCLVLIIISAYTFIVKNSLVAMEWGKLGIINRKILPFLRTILLFPHVQRVVLRSAV